MISLSKLYSSVIETVNNIQRRVLTVYGIKGATTADECAPPGDDSPPVQGMDAIYADTSNDGDPVIIGYLNTHQLAQPGEKRFYSMKVNPDGETYSLAFYTWMKSDGTYEIGGNTNNLIRYTALNNALQLEVAKINAELVKIAAGIATAGGSYTPTNITLDISAAKINEIKTL